MNVVGAAVIYFGHADTVVALPEREDVPGRAVRQAEDELEDCVRRRRPFAEHQGPESKDLLSRPHEALLVAAGRSHFSDQNTALLPDGELSRFETSVV